MRKKPVLGLVGLFVGLALSGCKDCDCGWGRSSRKETGPAQARVDKKGKAPGTEVSTWEDRQRSVADHSVAAKGADPARRKNPYDFSPKNYNVPTPHAAHAEVAEKPVQPAPIPSSDPAGLGRGGIEASEQMHIPPAERTPAPVDAEQSRVPPRQPMSMGEMSTKTPLAKPVDMNKLDAGTPPSKLLQDMDRVLEDPRPAPKKETAPKPVPPLESFEDAAPKGAQPKKETEPKPVAPLPPSAGVEGGKPAPSALPMKDVVEIPSGMPPDAEPAGPPVAEPPSSVPSAPPAAPETKSEDGPEMSQPPQTPTP